MNDWADCVLKRLYKKYLCSSETLVEKIQETLNHESQPSTNCDSTSEIRRNDSPRQALRRYEELNCDQSDMTKALKVKRDDLIKDFPERLIDDDRWNWCDYFERRKQEVYTRIKEIVGKDPTPENVECLMELAFIDAFDFTDHDDLLIYLFGLPLQAWELTYLVSMERVRPIKEWGRACEHIVPFLRYVNRFKDIEIIRNILEFWADDISWMIKTAKVPKTYSAEEMLLHAIFDHMPFAPGEILDEIIRIKANPTESNGLFNGELLDSIGSIEENIRREKNVFCPYCGQPLRNELTRQCLNCHMDWHDPTNVIKHNVDENKGVSRKQWFEMKMGGADEVRRYEDELAEKAVREALGLDD